MLVLSRKANETCEMPELGISIRILRCTPSHVQIGIEAPRAIRIMRGELATHEVRRAALDVDGQGLAAFHQLEAQILALTELSSISDRELAATVAEEALDALQRLRRTIVNRATAAPSTAPRPTADSLSPIKCVRETEIGYAISHLATSA